jgi:lactate dehydrogenase-like 2-hydroxyacid dehydrogenase
LISKATYTIKTAAAYENRYLREIKTKSEIAVHADKVYINDLSIFDRSLIGLTFGVQGLGRIGEAVAQRALALGAKVIVCQRNPERPKYQQKQERLRRLAQNRARIYHQNIDVIYVDKHELFRTSNIVTTLAATTSTTRYWVDRQALDMLATEAQGSVRILVNAGKGLLNEADLTPYLRERHDVEVRLDVLSDEQIGKAGKRFLGPDGRPLANLKISGHTAAAVPELRRLKVFNALNNLRLHIDGQKPNNILNPEVTVEH